MPALVVLLATGWLMLRARPLNSLLLGEDAAAALGVDVGRMRLQLLVLASLVTAVIVAVAGGVAFVGLMIPHVARMLVGPDHRRMLPVTVLVGALFLELVDIAARTVAAPLESLSDRAILDAGRKATRLPSEPRPRPPGPMSLAIARPHKAGDFDKAWPLGNGTDKPITNFVLDRLSG